MRDRLELIWPSNKKLSRLKLKRNGSTNAGRPAHSLPRTTRALKAKRPPAERALTRSKKTNKRYRETGRRIRLTSSPRPQSFFLL